MKIALISPLVPKSISDGVKNIERFAKEASEKGASIACLPESYLPGYPFEEFKVERSTPENMRLALDRVCSIAADNHIAIILPMDFYKDGHVYNAACVISKTGELIGYQTKNQLDPPEDNTWTPGDARSIFDLDGLRFGITICHEGFRYPEATRWAATRGAKIVFHPYCAGSNVSGPTLEEWGHKNNPYYEKAAILRAMENTIYFASCNYTTKYPESATAVLAPDGTCVAAQPYREPGVLGGTRPRKGDRFVGKKI